MQNAATRRRDADAPRQLRELRFCRDSSISKQVLHSPGFPNPLSILLGLNQRLPGWPASATPVCWQPMNDTFDQNFPETCGQNPPTTELLIMYEDVSSGLLAKRSVDRLSRQLDVGGGLNMRLWRFDLLGLPLLRERAAVEAATMDVILLAVKGRKAQPLVVEEWLHRWLDHKEDRPYALGVILEPDEAGKDGPHPVVTFTRKIAVEAGADFFCGVSEKPTGAIEALVTGLRARATDSANSFARKLLPELSRQTGGVRFQE